MKSSVTVLLISMLLLLSLILPVSAANSGDVAGVYYATDIVTTLNGAAIDAINIGGQTLISAEDMRYFGHAVVWDAKERTLHITETTAQVKNPPAAAHSDRPSGTVLGNYYVTDIVTYLDGTPIAAYNIGGRTYIHAEAMRGFGYDVKWFADARKLQITSPIAAGYVFSLPLTQGAAKEDGDAAVGACTVCYTKDGMTYTGDADFFDLTMHADGTSYTFTMAFYQYSGLFYSDALMRLLNPLVSESYDGSISVDPASLYDSAAKTLYITVNGQRAEKITVRTGAGNGHRDYIIEVSGLPCYTKAQLEEITLVIGASADLS